MSNNLPITKEQFINSIIPFINTYKRLPLLPEDNVEIEIDVDGEIEIRPYRAGRYIKEFFLTQDKMTKELFEQGIITYKLIGEVSGLTETVVKNIVEQSTKTPDTHARKMVHIFLNVDYYEKALGKYSERCKDCSKQCKQFYWVEMIGCAKYKAKASKKNK